MILLYGIEWRKGWRVEVNNLFQSSVLYVSGVAGSTCGMYPDEVFIYSIHSHMITTPIYSSLALQFYN